MNRLKEECGAKYLLPHLKNKNEKINARLNSLGAVFFSGSRDGDEGDVFFYFVIKTSIIKTIQILHVTDTVIEITTKKHFIVQNKQSLPV